MAEIQDADHCWNLINCCLAQSLPATTSGNIKIEGITWIQFWIEYVELHGKNKCIIQYVEICLYKSM